MSLGTGGIESLKLGQLGADFVKDSNPHTGDWGIIHALSAATFTSLTSTTITGDMSGMVLFGGDRIYGRFSAFQLTSGAVLAYKI